MSKDGRMWLSHSGIEGLVRCPRCFWLHYRKKIYQPEGIVSRLANRFDVVLKNHFDKFRESGVLPPIVAGKLDGILENPFQEKYFVDINDRYGFWGKLDECLVNEKDEHIPVDFKTASSDPRGKETLSAYQSQIDDYNFLLRESGKKISGFGYLVYVFPDEAHELHNGFPMIIHIVKLVGNPDNTMKRIQNAVPVLEAPMPQASANCPFCNWFQVMKSQLNGEDAPTDVSSKEMSAFKPADNPKKSKSRKSQNISTHQQGLLDF